MILLLTDKNDSHANYLIKKLENEGLNFYRFNLDVKSLKQTFVTYSSFEWSITQNGNVLDLKSVKCIWNRRTFVELLLDEEYDQSTDFKIWKNEWNKTLLGIYSYLRDKPWMNPWRNSYAAENKYLQMELAISCGLEIPATIVSNEKKVLLMFAKQKEEVALKLMHQDFYKNGDGDFKGLYVNKLNQKDLKKFAAKNENPIVLQEYVEKEFEVRYTVVEENHYVCKIDSQRSNVANIDWRRYDIANTPHHIINPPLKIKSYVSKLMKQLGLTYGALDFIVDKNKNWVFLEINSMGQFLWIEDLSGLKISSGIIEWMKQHVNINE